MALTGGARWKPDATTGSLETKMQWSDMENGQGLIVMVAQLVAFDDADFGGGAGQTPYRPGDPETERRLVVLDQRVIGRDLVAFAEMTQVEKDAEWAAALQAFWDSYPTSVKVALATSLWAAKRAAPIINGG